MSAWKSIELIKICDEIVDCINKTAPKVDYPTQYKMIRTTNVKKGVVNTLDVKYVTKEVYEKWTRRSVPQYGDVILTREAPLGEIGMITVHNEKIFLGQRLMSYRTNPKQLDKHFLLYALQESYMQGQIRSFGSGSTVEHMRVGDAEKIKIKLPPLQAQQTIASILSTYDDLIENNNHRISILEEMAQKLYREWFVKFRFPGYGDVKMVKSELGLIPEVWEILKTKDILKRLTAGNKYTQDNVFHEGLIPVIDQSRNDLLGFHNNKPNHIASDIHPIIIFGDHTCKMQLMVESFSVGPNVIPFISKINRPIQYIYYLVNSLVSTKEYKRHWTELVSKDVLVAPLSVCNDFSDFVTPLFLHINTLRRKNLNLKKQRDLLLPKLISGKINVG